MQTFLATFLLFLLAIATMAIGLVVGGRRLSGSCGGRDKDGKPLADCLCERKQRGECEHTEAAQTLYTPELPSKQS